MKHAVIALLCGVLATLTLPPFYLFPLLIPAFSGLVYLLLAATTLRRAFLIGWCFGLGYFVSGLYWFAYSLLVDAERFAWMIPFAVLGLPSVLAIYYGAGAGICWKIWQRVALTPLAKILVFSAIWLLTEMARGHWFTGFPWNPIALSWSISPQMVQGVALLGSYGFSWWTVLLATLPLLAFWPQERIAPKQRILALALSFVMIVIPYSFGALRLQQHPTEWTDTTLKLVQPSIPQVMKMNPEQRANIVKRHVALSLDGVGDAKNRHTRESGYLNHQGHQDSRLHGNDRLPSNHLTIWSETAFPYVMEAHSPPVEYATSRLLRQPNSYLITGGMRRQGEGWEHITNSMQVLAADGSITAYYDKIKLVPFGEFVPLRWLLPIESIAQGMHDFTAGTRGQIITLPNIPPFLPLICYEAIFPELLHMSSQRVGWILNVTNDGWFGESTGPYQHFEMTKLRAVEQGLPIVRVANNGISAIIDPLGREVQRLGLNAVGVIQGKLPAALPATLYAQIGDGWIVAGILLLTLLFCGVSVIRNMPRHTQKID
jgi:apolipoprotein N-acyltransferase